jgi:hypothetical protein
MNTELDNFVSGNGSLAGAVRRWFRGSTVNGRKVELNNLVDELERQAMTKADYVVDTRNLHMDLTHDNKPVLTFPDAEGGHLAFGIRPVAHAQIADKTGIPKRYYDRMVEEAPELLTDNVNHWLPQKDRRMIRTLDGEARAVLSDRFRTLDNADLFFAAAKTFRDAGAQIIRADLSDTRFYMRAIDPNFEAPIKYGDTIVGGVTVSNSEVGHGTMKVEQFALRVRCMNGMIGEDVFKKVHLGEKLDIGLYQADTVQATTEAIWKQTRDHILAAFDHGRLQDWADAMAGMELVDIPARTELAQGSWKGLDVSADEKDAILGHLFDDNEGHNKFGFVNAITATARHTPDADRRADLERLGYRLMNENDQQFEATMAQVVTVPRRAQA